jgi:hypothetical protein
VIDVTQDEKRKLSVLLAYWIDHNRQHGEEFKEWAEKARGFGDISIYNELTTAGIEMEKVNESLASALEKLKQR